MAHKRGEKGYIAEGAKARTGKAAHASVDSSFVDLGNRGVPSGEGSQARKMESDHNANRGGSGGKRRYK